ncbi:hypothetical protein BGZ83_009676 [Gryganskiella cystojenkinii]|nr:hypothetical protein BGZ83_009676 [Gryganskiella cystojenkinii]
MQKQAKPSSSSSLSQATSLFSSPGEDLYEEDGLKEQRTAVSVDSDRPSMTNTTESSTDASPQKVKIVFETFQKVRTEIEAKVGERILDIVKDKDPSRHGVYQALECTCGGQLDPPYNARLSAISDAEEDMLEYAVGRKVETSRLGCQIKIRPEMEGMIVKLPQY